MGDMQEVVVRFQVEAHNHKWAAIILLNSFAEFTFRQAVKGFAIEFPANSDSTPAETEPEENDPVIDVSRVQSQSDWHTWYEVTRQDGTPISCTCPDYKHRHKDNLTWCKHMAEVAERGY